VVVALNVRKAIIVSSLIMIVMWIITPSLIAITSYSFTMVNMFYIFSYSGTYTRFEFLPVTFDYAYAFLFNGLVLIFIPEVARYILGKASTLEVAVIALLTQIPYIVGILFLPVGNPFFFITPFVLVTGVIFMKIFKQQEEGIWQN